MGLWKLTFLRLVGAAALGLSLTASLPAALLPFTQNFNGLAAGTTITPSGFEEKAGAGTTIDYALNGTGLVFTSSSTTGGASRSAAIQFTDLGATLNPFTISTDFTLNAFAAPSTSTINLGLALLGDTTSAGNFSGGTQYRVLYTPSNAGRRLTIAEVSGGTTVGTTAQSAAQLTPTVGMSGTITVTGTYSGGTLFLDATLVSGATTLTASFSDTTPLTGNYFGYRTAINAVGGTASEDVTYDNFSATTPVPEPATWSVLASLGLGLIAWKRRR